jgi:hypothetical protein
LLKSFFLARHIKRHNNFLPDKLLPHNQFFRPQDELILRKLNTVHAELLVHCAWYIPTAQQT